ncbi:GGDEF domain-containing protein [Alkalibacterium putridalgicola]|uniref:GGDEF domain-containing protein n=1 Tax=Alkalibacterium putridalgicola TaxID=426703 RepID=UPI0034CDF3EC
MVSTFKKQLIWLMYIPVGILLKYSAYYTQVHGEPFLSVDYGLFLLLGILVGLFPIKTEDSILVLTPGISLATLVIFGFVPEIILSSVALIVLMMKANIGPDRHYRYPLNLLMFYFLSAVSAGAYFLTYRFLYLLFNEPFGIFALAVYMLVHLIANQLAMFVIDKYFYNRKKTRFFDENLTFQFYTSLFVVPLTFVLIYLYRTLGTAGIIIGAFPFLTVTVGTNFYYKSKSNNVYLRRVNAYSHELNAEKNSQNVLEAFLESLIHIFPADNLSYFSIKEPDRMVRESIYTKEGRMDSQNEVFKIGKESILYKAATSESILAYANSGDWKKYCRQDISYSAESAMVLPVKIREHTRGVILLTHQTRSMYDDMMISLVEGFHQYFSIALENAYHYEQLEESNETDYLTELSNLKGFSKNFEHVARKNSDGPVSLIVMDLDHFKLMNDTHGHQSGNDVLKQVADILKKQIKKGVYIARYGGEEFIILLSGVNKQKAYELAEDIRDEIEQTVYEVRRSIMTDEPAQVSVTASMGVASYPEDCSDVNELITLADRAMYMGSKQKGRNKVTMAHKGS